MTNTPPYYILDRCCLLQLRAAMQEASLEVQEVGVAKSTAEGVEQEWKCSDGSGDAFWFCICEVNDKNGLGLKPGTLCLIVGPPARKHVSDVFERFERTLIALGATEPSS